MSPIDDLLKDHTVEYRTLEVLIRIEAKLDAIMAVLNVVSSTLEDTMEGRPMPDLADFADELDALITEHLDANVSREALKATLAAKLKEMDDEDAAGEEPEDGEPEPA